MLFHLPIIRAAGPGSGPCPTGIPAATDNNCLWLRGKKREEEEEEREKRRKERRRGGILTKAGVREILIRASLRTIIVLRTLLCAWRGSQSYVKPEATPWGEQPFSSFKTGPLPVQTLHKTPYPNSPPPPPPLILHLPLHPGPFPCPSCYASSTRTNFHCTGNSRKKMHTHPNRHTNVLS